jgi:Mrp family chromosome partitioning ATPase
MASNVAEIAMNVTGAAPARARRVSGFAVGAAALAALSLLSALPLSFTASAELAFNMAIQPPAAAVRGIAQVLGSRELARDAIERLAPADVARLATDSLFAAAAGDAAALTEQAARRVVQDVSVTPINGGRGYDIAVSAATPALAARLADAYVAAALGLNARPEPDAVSPLPGLSGGASATVPMLPDVPGPLPFTLLAAALATFLFGRRQHHREPLPQGLVDRAALPLQLDSPHRITWLDGPAASGLALDEAVAHLLPHAVTGPQASEPGRGRLVCVTSDGLDEAASRCARTLARRLGDDAGVVLVVLDQSVDTAGLLDLGCEAADPGVRELLVGRARFGETLHRDPHSRAHVIPPGHLPPGWSSATGTDAPGPADEPADAARLGAVLDALRQTYDYVVVANPPLDPNDATLAESEPLVVCLTADTAPATAAVESFDALAAMRFSRIVMLRFATGEVLPPAEAEDILPPQVAPASPARGPETHPPVRRPSRPEPRAEEPQLWRGAA